MKKKMRLGSEGFICLKQWITRFSILTNGLNAFVNHSYD